MNGEQRMFLNRLILTSSTSFPIHFAVNRRLCIGICAILSWSHILVVYIINIGSLKISQLFRTSRLYYYLGILKTQPIYLFFFGNFSQYLGLRYAGFLSFIKVQVILFFLGVLFTLVHDINELRRWSSYYSHVDEYL